MDFLKLKHILIPYHYSVTFLTLKFICKSEKALYFGRAGLATDRQSEKSYESGEGRAGKNRCTAGKR